MNRIIVITECNKFKLLVMVRKHLRLGLLEAKSIADSVGAGESFTIGHSSLSKQRFEEIKSELVAVGAKFTATEKYDEEDLEQQEYHRRITEAKEWYMSLDYEDKLKVDLLVDVCRVE